MTKLRLTCLILVVALGCKKKDGDQPAPSSQPAKPAPVAVEPAATTPPNKPAEPAPAAPAPAAPAAPTAAKAPIAPPAWLAGVPAKPVTAKVGQLVWSIHGDAFGGDSARVHVEEVIAVDGNTATTRPLAWLSSGPDQWKHKPSTDEAPYKGIPGLLVIPAHTVDELKPKVGDNVFVFTGNTPTPRFAHVKAVEGGLVAYDLPNATGKAFDSFKTDLIEPYGKGVAPFTFVTYKDGSDQKLITVLALAGDSVYGYDSAGKLVTVKKASVKPLKPEFKPRKVGDKVYAFPYGTGKQDVIKEVNLPDYAYSVGYSLTGWEFVFDKLP